MVIDITGQIFGRATVIKYHSLNKHSQSTWVCKCSCGNEFITSSNQLKRGLVKSCGCLHRESTKARFLKHGESYKSKEYAAWHSIKMRCHNYNNQHYKDYGGRGIIMCDRWINSFENFLNDMGRAPSTKYSIDRIDNNGGYEPNNCKWSTQKEQTNNTRRNIKVTLNGVTKNFGQWCEELGLNRNYVNYKLRTGSTMDSIFNDQHLNSKGL